MDLLLSGISLGFIFNAAPGAIFAESLRRGIAGGFRPALHVQLGSLTGDFIWAVAGLSGIAALLSVPQTAPVMALLSAALLLYLAWQSGRDALAPLPAFSSSASVASALGTGALLSLANPMNLSYWAAMGGVVGAIAQTPSAAAFGLFLTGFMISSVAWCFICAAVIAMARRFVNRAVWSVVNGTCAAGFLAFAVIVLRAGLGW